LPTTTAVNITKKNKKKISDEFDIDNPQLLFNGSRLKRREQKINKVRPKTAKLEKEELCELRINMENSKKRCRKLLKKVARA